MVINDIVIDGNGIRITWSNNVVDQLVWSLINGKLVLSKDDGVGIDQEYVDKVLDAINRDNISTQLYGYLTSSTGGLGDIPVSRALVPPSNSPDLSILTLSGSNFLVDALNFSGGANESAYFQISPGSSISNLNLSVLVISSGTGVASLSVSVARLTPGQNLSSNQLATSTKYFSITSPNVVHSHTFVLNNVNIEPDDLIIFKIYRNSSDVNDTVSQDLSLIKIKVS